MGGEGRGRSKFDHSWLGNGCVYVYLKFLMETSQGEFVDKLLSLLS